MNKHTAILLALLCCFCGKAGAQGLSTSVSAWATVGLGRYGGSGFGSSLSLTYTDTIAPRLTLAAGGYIARMQWRGQGYGTAGLAAQLSYRPDEHWEAVLFVQKGFTDQQRPMPWMMASDWNDKIGVAVNYHFSPSFTLGVSIWEERIKEPPLGWMLDAGRQAVGRLRQGAADMRHAPPVMPAGK